VNKIGGKYISTGRTMSITFSEYASVAIIYGIINATNYIMYLFGNGYLVPIKTINNVNVSLSSNYKTISITNNINTSTLWVGVLNTFNVDMTIN